MADDFLVHEILSCLGVGVSDNVYSKLASFLSANHTDLDALKTSNHTDLDALKTSIDSLADWLKKKLAYSFDYDFIEKSYTVDYDDITLNDLEVGKSYFIKVYVQDAETSPTHNDVILPVGDYLFVEMGNVYDTVGDKTPYDLNITTLRLHNSSVGSPLVLRAFDSGDIGEYYYFMIHRCS